jgi:hypothetical protein
MLIAINATFTQALEFGTDFLLPVNNIFSFIIIIIVIGKIYTL